MFRLAAIALGLLPFLIAEWVCSVRGIGLPDQSVDPFVGFDSVNPLFVANPETGRHEIAESRMLCFRPDSFQTLKPESEFRVFCLGGSTVQGRPYAIETAFTTWFELSLRAADPNRSFDVINCGGISYATYRLVPIMEEVLNYEPDLIVLYTGHNEFLEDRSYATVKERSATTRQLLRQAKRSRIFNFAYSKWNQLLAWRQQVRPVLLPEEVQTRLDYAGGLQLYHRDLAWQQGVVEHFDFNVRRMIALCRDRDVPIWLVDPVCNLRSSPPFKSQNRDNLQPDKKVEWDRLRNQASARFRTNVSGAIELLEAAMAIDDQHAGLAYDLGKAYETIGDMTLARQHFVRAKDLDICPLRLIEKQRERLHDIVVDLDVPLIDVNGMICRQSRNGIPGGFLLVDHVHPSISAHQDIAALLMETAIETDIVKPSVGWQKRRDTAAAAHLAELDDRYYMDGQRRLEGLRSWTQGRVTMQRDEDH